MRESLNEKQWRQYLAMEAKERGNIAEVGRRGQRLQEYGQTGDERSRSRRHLSVRRADRDAEGGGRKPLAETDATLLADLEGLLEPKGDPMSLVQWTSKSLSHLTKALALKGHTIKKSALAQLLHQRRFSLRANKKTIEGKGHPDRNAQFEHSTGKCETFKQQGNPIISVDCKKKELIGQFKNHGREWQAKGEETCVNVYDFVSLASGKAVPYGVYDLVHKSGFVNVGIDHETAEFAVESIRRWWHLFGKKLYPDKKELLITADSGGSSASQKPAVEEKATGVGQ